MTIAEFKQQIVAWNTQNIKNSKKARLEGKEERIAYFKGKTVVYKCIISALKDVKE